MSVIAKLGAAVTDVPADVVCASAFLTAINRYMTFEVPCGTDYVVPAGKTLRITLVQFDYSGAWAKVRFGYGDDAVAEGAAAPSNPIFLTHGLMSLGTTARSEAKCSYDVPAGKYPFLYATEVAGAGTMTIMGYLY